MEGRAAGLHKEYLDAQELAAQKKAEYEFAANSIERAFNLPLKIGAEYQCVFCGMERGVQAGLRGARTDDGRGVLRCNNGHDIPID